MNSKSGVLVVDFGAQYAQLIARRVREANVYSEIVPSHITAAEVSAKNPAAIVLSGGPSSVYSEGAPKFDSAILQLGIPVFGICYGFQVMAAALGGVVSQTGKSEFGRTEIKAETGSKIFKSLPASQSVWMSHGDAVTQAPAGFALAALVEELHDAWVMKPAGKGERLASGTRCCCGSALLFLVTAVHTVARVGAGTVATRPAAEGRATPGHSSMSVLQDRQQHK